MEHENALIRRNKHSEFCWEGLGDIKEGRGELGEDMPVFMYRMMQFTLMDVLCKSYGLEKANEYFRSAGILAGSQFARHMLDLNVDFNTFLDDFKKSLEDMKIGILRTEAFDPESGSIVLTVGKDLDCSGLPNTNETVCNFDEGFISGVLESYTGHKYNVREVGCWASGDKLCRFNGYVIKD